jgi:hypothetical protein
MSNNDPNRLLFDYPRLFSLKTAGLCLRPGWTPAFARICGELASFLEGAQLEHGWDGWAPSIFHDKPRFLMYPFPATWSIDPDLANDIAHWVVDAEIEASTACHVCADQSNLVAEDGYTVSVCQKHRKMSSWPKPLLVWHLESDETLGKLRFVLR